MNNNKHNENENENSGKLNLPQDELRRMLLSCYFLLQMLSSSQPSQTPPTATKARDVMEPCREVGRELGPGRSKRTAQALQGLGFVVRVSGLGFGHWNNALHLYEQEFELT